MEFPVEKRLAEILHERKRKDRLRTLTHSLNQGQYDFSSNDFLSLSCCDELDKCFLQEYAREKMDRGTNSISRLRIASGGSRSLDGNSHLAEQLEQEIAKFHGAITGLLFKSGFDANVAVYSTIPQPRDFIVYDSLIHASTHDGMRLSRLPKTHRLAFKHNSVQDLKQLLIKLKQENMPLTQGSGNVFVGIEALYSMDGDIPPLVEIHQLLKSLFPKRNAYIIIDEAHSNGIFGPDGKGLVSELGLESEIFIRMHTFGKALACNGAIVLCSDTVRKYLLNYGRTFIYTTAATTASLCHIRASYGMLPGDECQRRRQALLDTTNHLTRQLVERVVPLATKNNIKLILPPERLTDKPAEKISENPPIIPIETPQAKLLAQYCQQAGFMVRAIMPPTVPHGHQRVRICTHSENSRSQIDSLIQTICNWIQEPNSLVPKL